MPEDVHDMLEREMHQARDRDPEGVSVMVAAPDEAVALAGSRMVADYFYPCHEWGETLYFAPVEPNVWEVVIEDRGPRRTTTQAQVALEDRDRPARWDRP